MDPASSIGPPHAMQKRAPGLTGAWQCGQVAVRWAPQAAQ
jgi:hypothetical protein